MVLVLRLPLKTTLRTVSVLLCFFTDPANVFIRVNLDGTIFAYNCCMRLAHVMSATRIMSCKSGVQHPHNSCTQHQKCRRILKHVLKLYGSRSHHQNGRMTSCLRTLLDASSALQKSHTKVVSKYRISPRSEA